MIGEEVQVNLNLTVSELNTLAQALGQMPYATVFALIQKIKDQALPQIDLKEVKTN
jgi:hypothetical protein